MYLLLLDSVRLMPSVFMRTLPVAVLTALIYFGLIENTPNPLWKLVFVCLLTTPCIAIVRMAALRAALVTVGRTTPPTIDHLTKAQMRLAYMNLLPINIVQTVAFVVVTALLAVGLDTAVMDVATEFATTGVAPDLTGLSEELRRVAQAAGWLFSIIAALGFGAMGTAMAATAANAAEKKPRHDITFGVGYNFWKLTVLYYIAQALNAVLVVLLSIFVLAALQIGDGNLTVYAAPAALTAYISLHFSTTAAGAALSYSQLLDEEAEIRAFVRQNLAGPEASREDLRALRRARQTH